MGQNALPRKACHSEAATHVKTLLGVSLLPLRSSSNGPFQLRPSARASEKNPWRAADAWSQIVSLFSGTPPAISSHGGHGSWHYLGEVQL
eukprot:s2132_g6.t1